MLYRYMFWGFPIGVSELPTFALTVCIMTVTGIKSGLFASFSTAIERGTKVISATSLVIIAEEKKQINTRQKISSLMFFALFTSDLAQAENTLAFEKPAITDIRQKSRERVL